MGNIARGIPGTEMPGHPFDPPQMESLVAFIRSLTISAGPGEVTGDAAAGQRIYEGKGGCVRCHMIAGKGGRLGPDLTRVGSKATAELRASLISPDQDVPAAYWAVNAVTPDGRRLSGVLLNQDTYSIQFLDLEENLVSRLKSELKQLQVTGTSLMPSFAGKLTASDIDDVVAYLRTLRP
jgi:putative heme-binding domain-containing protein